MSENAKEGVCLTNFGEILMQLRQEKHLSQAELGNIIYVSGGTISNYEKGVHYPDVEKLIALAEYFNVSIDYLLGRSRSKLSTDVFDQSLHEDTTVGDVVLALQHFSPARKRAICVTIPRQRRSTSPRRAAIFTACRYRKAAARGSWRTKSSWSSAA